MKPKPDVKWPLLRRLVHTMRGLKQRASYQARYSNVLKEMNDFLSLKTGRIVLTRHYRQMCHCSYLAASDVDFVCPGRFCNLRSDHIEQLHAVWNRKRPWLKPGPSNVQIYISSLCEVAVKWQYVAEKCSENDVLTKLFKILG